METLITVLLNLALMLAALLSAQLAVVWGELGSYPLQGDTSGMGGFGVVIFLMPIRWVLVAAGLLVGVRRVAFAGLLCGLWVKTAVALGLHLAMGVVAYQVLEWIARAVRDGTPGPQRVAIVFGLLLPTTIWVLAFLGVNRGWIVRHGWIAAVVLGLIVWVQLAGWRQGYVRPTLVRPLILLGGRGAVKVVPIDRVPRDDLRASRLPPAASVEEKGQPGQKKQLILEVAGCVAWWLVQISSWVAHHRPI